MSPDKRGEFALSFLSTYGVKPNGPPAAIEGGSRMRRRPSRTPWAECIMLKSKLSRPRRRQTLGRILGPLGAGRQQGIADFVRGLGSQGEGRAFDRLHPLARLQA